VKGKFDFASEWNNKSDERSLKIDGILFELTRIVEKMLKFALKSRNLQFRSRNLRKTVTKRFESLAPPKLHTPDQFPSPQTETKIIATFEIEI
jgi:hypothetical protein